MTGARETPAAPRAGYPPAHQLDLVETLHGRQVADPFRWLEDPDSPQTRNWVAAQEDLYAIVAETWPVRKEFATRISELLETGDIGLPRYRGDACFFTRRAPNGELPVLYLRVDVDGEPDQERVLLDPLVIDPTGTTTLDSWSPSPSGALIAVLLSVGGTEDSELLVIDVATGTTVDGPIDRCRFSSIGWLADESGFYYVRRVDPRSVPTDESAYHRRVRLRRFDRDPDNDPTIFGADRDKASVFSAETDSSGRWLVLHSQVGTQHANEVWLADLSRDDPEQPRLTPVVAGHEAETRAHVADDGRLYLRTDLGAPRFRLAVADPARPDLQHWSTLLPEDCEAVLQDIAILNRAATPVLLALRARHAVSEIDVHDLQTGVRTASLALPPLSSVSCVRTRFGGGHQAWFDHTSFDQPQTIYCYDADTAVLSVHERAPRLVATHTPIDMRQVTYNSADGTPVRMFVLSQTSQPDAPRPTILTGYGGFNVSRTPTYSPAAIAWVEAGGVYAVANIRGGGEEGTAWHEAGYRANKQNVFDDFHAAACFLVGNGFSSPDRLGIQGGSNGGLLVGVAMTQHPELFRAVVCSAPLLDMVRYERFGLGRFWSHEYGSAAVSTELSWLLSYSPYHHVQPEIVYPATIFTVFEGDTRVDVLHARKMCAALQSTTAGTLSDRPILFRLETGVGHGARATSRAAGLAADQLAFFEHYLGATDS